MAAASTPAWQWLLDDRVGQEARGGRGEGAHAVADQKRGGEGWGAWRRQALFKTGGLAAWSSGVASLGLCQADEVGTRHHLGSYICLLALGLVLLRCNLL
jgi:hypothetical protein